MAVAYASSKTLAYGSRTNSTVEKPEGTVSGDLLVMRVILAEGGTPTGTFPAGWTLVPGPTQPTAVAEGGFNVRMWLYYKVAGGSEPTTYTTTHVAMNSGVVIARFTGAGAEPKLKAANKTGTATAYKFAGVTTEAAESMIAIFGHDWGDTALNLAPPTGTTPTFTERVDITLSYFATGLLAAAGALAEKTMTNNSTGTHPWATFTLAIEPPSEGGGKVELTAVPATIKLKGVVPLGARAASALSATIKLLDPTPTGRRVGLALPAPLATRAPAPTGVRGALAAIARLITRGPAPTGVRGANAPSGTIKLAAPTPGSVAGLRLEPPPAAIKLRAPAPGGAQAVAALTASLKLKAANPTFVAGVVLAPPAARIVLRAPAPVPAATVTAAAALVRFAAPEATPARVAAAVAASVRLMGQVPQGRRAGLPASARVVLRAPEPTFDTDEPVGPIPEIELPTEAVIVANVALAIIDTLNASAQIGGAPTPSAAFPAQQPASATIGSS